MRSSFTGPLRMLIENRHWTLTHAVLSWSTAWCSRRDGTLLKLLAAYLPEDVVRLAHTSRSSDVCSVRRKASKKRCSSI